MNIINTPIIRNLNKKKQLSEDLKFMSLTLNLPTTIPKLSIFLRQEELPLHILILIRLEKLIINSQRSVRRKKTMICLLVQFAHSLLLSQTMATMQPFHTQFRENGIKEVKRSMKVHLSVKSLTRSLISLLQLSQQISSGKIDTSKDSVLVLEFQLAAILVSVFIHAHMLLLSFAMIIYFKTTAIKYGLKYPTVQCNEMIKEFGKTSIDEYAGLEYEDQLASKGTAQMVGALKCHCK